MKKILVASSLQYSQSNRGIDIITQALLDMDMNVTHLTFPSKEAFLKGNKNFTQLGIKGRKIAYYERIMKNFPKNITQYFINQTIKPLKNFNFSDYDYIILESGKPIFLIDIIPKNIPIVYRQSDSVEFIISKNSLFHLYEKKLIERSQKVITVNRYFYNNLKNIYGEKICLITNGFDLNEEKQITLKNPYKEEKNIKALYFGLFPLSFEDVSHVLKKFKHITFYFIGPKLFTKKEQKKLFKNENFKYLGYMKNENIQSYIKYSDFIFIPYKDSYKLNYSGLTSKYLLAMYYEKPIISKKIGLIDDFKNTEVMFYEDFVSLDNFIGKMKKDYKIIYKINFNIFNKNNKILEYKIFFENLFNCKR